MNIRFSRARKSSRRHNVFPRFFRDDANAADRERRWSRMRKFLSYYRPHLPLLLADLLCAILVAGTAVALPLCANIVTSRLLALPDIPQAFAQILTMGGVMLVVLAVQIVAIFFVDYRGHVMGARIESDGAAGTLRALPEALVQLLRPPARRPADEPHHQRPACGWASSSTTAPRTLPSPSLKYRRRHVGTVLHRSAIAPAAHPAAHPVRGRLCALTSTGA